MKKWKSMLPILLLLLSGGCTTPKEAEEQPAGAVDLPIKAEIAMQAKVISMNEENILVANLDETAFGGLYTLAADTPVVGDAEISSGDIIQIDYDGSVMETYPAILGNVASIQLQERQEDMTAFYKGVLLDLLSVDAGLNDDIEFIALDLSKAENLLPAEREALCYLLWNATQVEVFAASYAELLEMGKMENPESAPALANGILLSVETTVIEENRFTFTARKWRSALGAYTFYDCNAQKEDTGWSYTVGAEMIS